MPWQEQGRWLAGSQTAAYYEELLRDAAERPERDRQRLKIIKPHQMPWELSRHGLLKHLVHERMNVRAETIDVWMQVLLPGSRSGKHRHLAEEAFYVVEGRGYDLHWDCDFEIGDTYRLVEPPEPKRFEWKAGDVVYIPPATAHQHFNLDPDRPCRLIFAQNRLYRWAGLNDLVQLENAPEYDAGLTLEQVLEKLRAAARV